MARRRNRRRNSQRTRSTRAYHTRPNRRLRSPYLVDKYSAYNNRFIEARRTRTTTYTRTKKTAPKLYRANFTTTKGLKRLNSTPPLLHSVSPQKLKKLQICVRRKQRKEVLHAYKKTGKGGQRRPRPNPYPHVKC